LQLIYALDRHSGTRGVQRTTLNPRSTRERRLLLGEASGIGTSRTLNNRWDDITITGRSAFLRGSYRVRVRCLVVLSVDVLAVRAVSP
jgi:hypothetical protein